MTICKNCGKEIEKCPDGNHYRHKDKIETDHFCGDANSILSFLKFRFKKAEPKEP